MTNQELRSQTVAVVEVEGQRTVEDMTVEVRVVVRLVREGGGRGWGDGGRGMGGWERETPPLTTSGLSHCHCSWCQLQHGPGERGRERGGVRGGLPVGSEVKGERDEEESVSERLGQCGRGTEASFPLLVQQHHWSHLLAHCRVRSSLRC